MNALMHKEFKLILNPLFYLIALAFSADPDPPVGVLRSAVVFLLYGRAQPLYPVQDPTRMCTSPPRSLCAAGIS